MTPPENDDDEEANAAIEYRENFKSAQCRMDDEGSKCPMEMKNQEDIVSLSQ